MKTSFEMQSDDMTARHRDGEHNPLERPQALEEKDKVIVDGTLHVDQGRYFVFQVEVGMDLKTSQVTARHFELTMFRQQQGTTAKSTYSEEDYSIQADFARNPKTATTARVAAREEAAISRQQRWATSTEQCKQFDSEG